MESVLKVLVCPARAAGIDSESREAIPLSTVVWYSCVMWTAKFPWHLILLFASKSRSRPRSNDPIWDGTYVCLRAFKTAMKEFVYILLRMKNTPMKTRLLFIVTMQIKAVTATKLLNRPVLMT